MSLPRATPVDDGRLSGTIYDFGAIGDTLPEHSHGETDKHYTIVCTGSIKIFGPWGNEIVNPGDIRRFKPGLLHGFEAMAPDSRVVNLKY